MYSSPKSYSPLAKTKTLAENKEKVGKKKEKEKGTKKKEKEKGTPPTSPLVLTLRESHTLQLFADNFSIKGERRGEQRPKRTLRERDGRDMYSPRSFSSASTLLISRSFTLYNQE